VGAGVASRAVVARAAEADAGEVDGVPGTAPTTTARVGPPNDAEAAGSSLRIVPVPVPVPMVALVGTLRLTVKVSLGSMVASPRIGTAIVPLIELAEMVSVPLAAV